MSIDAHGCSVDAHRCPWMPRGCSSMPMDAPWMLIDVHGCPVDAHGCPSIPIDAHRRPSTPIDVPSRFARGQCHRAESRNVIQQPASLSGAWHSSQLLWNIECLQRHSQTPGRDGTMHVISMHVTARQLLMIIITLARTTLP